LLLNFLSNFYHSIKFCYLCYLGFTIVLHVTFHIELFGEKAMALSALEQLLWVVHVLLMLLEISFLSKSDAAMADVRPFTCVWPHVIVELIWGWQKAMAAALKLALKHTEALLPCIVFDEFENHEFIVGWDLLLV